jgi:hypothetical protein
VVFVPVEGKNLQCSIRGLFHRLSLRDKFEIALQQYELCTASANFSEKSVEIRLTA